MSKQKFNRIVHHYFNVPAEDRKKLEKLAGDYPYSQALHTLIAKAHHDARTDKATETLHFAAMYATDRTRLREIIQGNAPVTQEPLSTSGEEDILSDLEQLKRNREAYEKMLETEGDTTKKTTSADSADTKESAPEKAVRKPSAKAPAKATAKTPAKSTAKTPAKSAAKTPAKSAAKPPAKKTTKSPAKKTGKAAGTTSAKSASTATKSLAKGAAASASKTSKGTSETRKTAAKKQSSAAKASTAKATSASPAKSAESDKAIKTPARKKAGRPRGSGKAAAKTTGAKKSPAKPTSTKSGTSRAKKTGTTSSSDKKTGPAASKTSKSDSDGGDKKKTPVKPKADKTLPETSKVSTKKKPSGQKKGDEDPDELIENFIKKEPSLINRPVEFSPNQEDLSIESTRFHEDLISENLALIMLNQGKKGKALEIYKKLIWKFPQKKAYFAARIEELTNQG